jgi:dihydrofolate reductase
MSQENMRKIIVSEWVTADGVFDADSMDVWFNPYHSDERAAYIKETIHGSDALLLGGVTYEMLASYWPHQKNDDMGPASKLNSMPKYIVSSKPLKAEWNNSTIIKENVVEAITKLKREPGQDFLITGSATLVQSLMETDLIDEYHFLVHPIIMGSGKRFFKGMHTTKLKLVKTKTFSLGVILLCYQPAKN